MAMFSREHLETLLVAVDAGTFDAAARHLRITPSAVSQRIKALEQSVGRVLLQRSTPVRPTADGEVVLRHARQVRLLDDETTRALSLAPAPDAAAVPSVSLAVNADSLATWFLDALVVVRQDTEVVFDLHREDQERTADLLRSGVVAAAVTAERRPVQGCTSEPLGVMRYLPVASPGFVQQYLDGETGPDTIARLDAVPLVDFDRADGLQQGFLAAVLGHAPRSARHFVPTSADFARAVALGLGWGLLPEEQCRDDLDDGRLVLLAADRWADVGLWWQRWNLASPLLDRVTAAVVSTAAQRLRR